jgi:5-methyltetrahydrofolate--homocysteine methyltransferase
MIATVEGDVHDIGKNVVKVVAESFGYNVIDLGKNVLVSTVVQKYLEYKPKAVLLSALMTTTVENMKRTIIELKKIPSICPIVVGGAVLNPTIAKSIGADYYGKDAIETVGILQKIC